MNVFLIEACYYVEKGKMRMKTKTNCVQVLSNYLILIKYCLYFEAFLYESFENIFQKFFEAPMFPSFSPNNTVR